MGRDHTPFPNIGLEPLIDHRNQPPMQYPYSGELTANLGDTPLGAVRRSGRIKEVFLSVGASGKDDSSSLQVEGDVLINGVTCLTTNPIIAHVSGEASQQKTTKITGDTGITQAVISSANTVTAGDVITCSLTLTRTASPTTEISSPIVVVEFEPVNATPAAY